MGKRIGESTETICTVGFLQKLSTIDDVTKYCGMPRYALDRLQRVMNAAARMLCGAGKYSHIYSFIRDISTGYHAVPQRVHFKLCLTYKVTHGLEICSWLQTFRPFNQEAAKNIFL